MAYRVHRRAFLATVSSLTTAGGVLGSLRDTYGDSSPLGLAAFSSHQHWKVARRETSVARPSFHDALGFYDYARSLGGDGVQANLRGRDLAFARALRHHVERTGGYYEGDVSLPRTDDSSDLDAFENDVRLASAAGATVARTVLTGARRYEAFTAREQFDEFRRNAERRLAAALPIAARHGLKLAVENHKDLTTPELIALLRRFDSEWLGVTVDTGNNLALLEDPHETIAALAPYALTVHLKDMAIQPDPDGFLLSEVPFGRGFLDLPRLVHVLRVARPAIAFNVEMATRDPLHVPCRTPGYWETFDERDESTLAAALERVERHPPRTPPPSVSGRPIAEVLTDEEANNRLCLAERRSLPLRDAR